ncbi:hypothetical protein D5086_013188 [Populus alba]|uniref:Uncharacterized protein n=1 Tax=Populus alba TaxID=43335 RepID=A0ACC4C4J9_POPAL
MGIFFSKMFSSVFGNKEARILVLGLDNAGKTTILYRLQMGEVVSTIPTIGFNVETVQYNNIKFQVWDLGGQTSIRPYWRCYFPNTQAIIYVVDSSDTDRLVIAKDEFHAILEEEELRGAVVLIYANKQDLPGALDDAAVTEALELHKIKNRQWAIFKTSAVKGEGLFEGLDWRGTLVTGTNPFNFYVIGKKTLLSHLSAIFLMLIATCNEAVHSTSGATGLQNVFWSVHSVASTAVRERIRSDDRRKAPASASLSFQSY